MSRKLDLSAFAGDEDDEEEAAVFFAKPKTLALNELKTKTFSHGITKKSKKDLEREAEERKRKQEEEALAKLNAELEMNEAGPSGPSYGARGMGMGRGRPQGSGFVRAGGSAYEGVRLPGPPSGPSNMPPRGPSAMGFKPFQPRAPSPPPPAVSKPKGKRAMDNFLLEIKKKREKVDLDKSQNWKDLQSPLLQAPWEHNPAARAAAAAQADSTNLFVVSYICRFELRDQTNLPPNVQEESLGLFFGKYGPIGTVKIMWPRGEDEILAVRKGRGALTGFVNFMAREDAAKALNELDGFDWGGNQIRVAWGKPMPLPAVPIYDLGTGSSKERERSSSPARHRESRRRRSRSRSSSSSPPPHLAKSHKDVTGSRAASRSRSPRSDRFYSPSSSRSPSPPRKQGSRDVWLDQVKEEDENFVKAVAKRVLDNGKGFENLLREKEQNNPKFAFLFKDELPEYHLYKYTLDIRYRFPTPPTAHFDDSGYASLYSTDSAEDSEKERTEKGKLGRLARKRFESMLRAMSGTRGEIARAMEFALKRAEAADEIADVLIRSLMVDGTPVPRKVARLHLVSDILHNSASSLPNVWRYRLAFEKRLQPVFAHLSTVYQSLLAYSGQMSADVFKAQVMVVLDIWESWIVYTQETSQALRQLLLGEVTLAELESAKINEKAKAEREAKPVQPKVDAEPGTSKGFKASGFKSSFKRVLDPATEAENLLNEIMAGGGAGGDDVDGEEMDMALDGEDMDLDGEEMDLDGEPMDQEDDDLDGEPM